MDPTLFNLPIKYYVLGLLVVQNGGAVLLMRAVRALPGEKEFVTQTAVIMQETIKACTCVAILLYKHRTLRKAFENRSEWMKTSVPALLYLVQNNLQYVAVGFLDAATYAVTYQTKVFWVAVCSVFLLRRTVLKHQWIALAILMSGVCAVQLNEQKASKSVGGSHPVHTFDEWLLGVVVLLSAALCSSLAAVSFEKLLKGHSADVWTRNLQLACFSLICGAVPLLLSRDGAVVRQKGFFHGYTPLTWCCIFMNGWGGLLVGAVIKYANAILKDIAIGASICVSAVGSIVFFESPITWNLALGVMLVSWAVPLFAGRAHFGLPLLRPPKVKAGEPPAPGSPLAPAPSNGSSSGAGAADPAAKPSNGSTGSTEDKAAAGLRRLARSAARVESPAHCRGPRPASLQGEKGS